MRKEVITDKEAICILIIFIIGSTLILGIGGDAKNDRWVSGVIGLVLAIPFLLIYARIQTIFQGRDIFDILIILLGKIGGRFVAVIYIWYGFHLGAMVIRNFGEFVNVVVMPETPMFVLMVTIGAVAIMAVKLGIEVIGRTCAYLLPILIVIVIIVQFLGIPEMRTNHIKPFFSSTITSVLDGAFSSFAFPFAESVVFLGVFFTLKTKKSPYRVYFYGVFLAGLLIIAVTIRNILILGPLGTSLYFPSHVAVSRISIGDFLQRIEVSVAFVFGVAALIKISICLFVTAKGVAKVCNLNDYRSVVIQLGLLMVYFAQFIYKDIMTMSNWAFKIYPFYALPFQAILPVFIWIMAEIKKNKITAKKQIA
ncbi:GerAB/ArcD/ProY family transporter [Ruminiclostridium cellobioparum]|uniref:GerAB/ArcD/ProY family transporter n=1 Tax=Ruminiclostridium cellobioparum TaxID=29355 RepID=UPI000483D22C|nr:endospore germination permease [Ruminiclostridium cellobioparum]